MDEFFKNYREKISNHLLPQERDEFKRLFYRPVPYVLLSSFDLAVLALVDDFEFPVQKFHPFDPLWPKDAEFRGFPHRTTIGPAITWRNPDHIAEIFSDTFLLRRPPPPLIGICQVEVNSSLLIGAGGNFLRCMSKSFKSCFDRMWAAHRISDETRLIILESYAWHEFTLLVLSNSFVSIRDLLREIRRMTLVDVGYYLAQEPNPSRRESNLAEWRELLSRADVYGLMKRSTRPCPRDEPHDFEELFTLQLQQYTIARRELMGSPSGLSEPFGSHAIFNTTTLLGYSADLLVDMLHGKSTPEGITGAANIIGKPADVDKQRGRGTYLIRNWTAKAGHLSAATEALKAHGGYVDTAGRGDFCYPCRAGDSLQFNMMSSREVVEDILRTTALLKKRRDAVENVRKMADSTEQQVGRLSEPVAGIISTQTTLAFAPEDDVRSGSAGHASANDIRQRFAFTRTDIQTVDSQLRKLKAPKVVSEKVHNVLALFNEGVLDNFLFGSFLELRPYVERILAFIKHESNNRGSQGSHFVFCERLDRQLECFTQGWRNRFHAGWRLGDVSDFNLEFKGGIQQLVSAFQHAYQSLTWLCANDPQTLAIVTSKPSLCVSEGAVHLSLFDIFTPEFFASRACHEAAEPALELISQDVAAAGSLKDVLALTSADPAIKSDPKNRMSRLRLEALVELDHLQRAAAPSGVPLSGLCNLLKSSLTAPHPENQWRNFFNQLFADICNFQIVYLGDVDLYTFWLAANWAFDPSATKGAKDPYPRDESMLLRVFLAISSDGRLPLDALEVVARHWKEPLVSRVLVEAVHGFCAELMRSTAIPEWLQQVGKFAVRGVREMKNLKPGGLKLSDPPLAAFASNDFAVLRGQLKQRSLDAKAMLGEGKAFDGGALHLADVQSLFDPEKQACPLELSRWLDTCDVIVLMHAYLCLLKDAFYPADRDLNSVVPRRDDDDGDIDDNKLHDGKHSTLLFDPRRGTLATTLKSRGDYFMWRCSFVRSLCDMAEKSKLAHCYGWWQRMPDGGDTTSEAGA